MSDKKKSFTGIHSSQWNMVDHDYLDQLTESDFEWLQKFDREYYSAIFEDDSIHKNVRKTRREAWERQNKAKRDIWKESQRTTVATSSHLAKLTLSDLDLDELHDKLGPDGAREKVLETALDHLRDCSYEHAKVVLIKLMGQYDKLRDIYRREFYTRNPKGTGGFTKKKVKRGKK